MSLAESAYKKILKNSVQVIALVKYEYVSLWNVYNYLQFPVCIFAFPGYVLNFKMVI